MELGPRRLTTDDARAVMASSDAVALGLMRAYARSYAAVLGGVVIGAAASAAFALTGRRGWAALAALDTGAGVLVVVEARRRARQWEAVIDARLTMLAGAG